MSRRPTFYGFPDMGRTGLAHSLLAWARCAVWCRDTGATMLAPRWLRVRVGPYLRRERDKRNYFFLFHRGAYIGEPKRSAILAASDCWYAELDLPDPGTAIRKNTVVIFRNALAHNERKFFHHVAGEGAFLRGELMKMTRSRYLPPPPADPFIAIHVRMGDFGVASPAQLRAGGTNTQIPPEWYAATLEQLRRQLGTTIPAIVFSDGSDQSLAPLLKQPSVARAPRQASVTDLLSIAQARVLIASGSGFSRWGAFLGGVPCISFPGQGFHRHAFGRPWRRLVLITAG